MQTHTARRGFLLGTLAGCAGLTAAHPDLAGVWSGFLDADDPPALLTLSITGSDEARLTVMGAGNIPLAHFKAADARIAFSTSAPPLRFDGTLNASGDLDGTLRRGSTDIPLTFVRGDLFTEPAMPALPPGPLTPERLHALRTAAACPAMGVAWQRGDAPARVLVDGLRAKGADASVQPGDRWHLGSVTKSMTATLAARLVEQGRMAWTTPLRELLGTAVPDMHAGYRELNLLHLLSHRAGLMRDAPPESYARLPQPLQRLAYTRAALKPAPVGEAGTSMLYSNADYVVAGLVLELVGHAPWEELLATHVMQPLGVADFGFGPPGLNQPQGHRMGPRGLEPVRSDVPFALGPAGSVHMGLAGLCRYLAAHRDQPASFLQPTNWAALHTPPFGGRYALGWDVSESGTLSHGGTNNWWKSEVRVDRRQDLVCAAVTNVLNRNGQRALMQLLDARSLS